MGVWHTGFKQPATLTFKEGQTTGEPVPNAWWQPAANGGATVSTLTKTLDGQAAAWPVASNWLDSVSVSGHGQVETWASPFASSKTVVTSGSTSAAWEAASASGALASPSWSTSAASAINAKASAASGSTTSSAYSGAWSSPEVVSTNVASSRSGGLFAVLVAMFAFAALLM